MLTFPALNGIAFIFSRHDTVDAITETMLWMPLINGMLCVAFLATFIASATPVNASALAWWLALGMALLWLALATRPCVRRGVAQHLQWSYAAMIVLFGAGLTLAWWYFTGTGISTSDAATKPALSWLKVALFAVAMLLLIVLPPRFRWKDGASGILSGLPLISLAGLLIIGQDSMIDVEVRRALFTQMMFGVWLAPAMAVTFIFSVSRALKHQRAHQLRVVVVTAGWILCFTAIAATGALLQWLISR